MSRRSRRFAALLGMAVVALMVSAGSASATYHLIKIRSIYRGPSPDTAFVELQMYADGQNLVGGHSLSVNNPAGTSGDQLLLTGNVANGQSQRMILIRDLGSPLPSDYYANGLGADLGALATGGSLCWDVVDCVGWGNATAVPIGESPIGQPIAGSLSSTKVNVRRIDRGCATALDEADDTNDSASDFEFAVGYPVRTNSATPTETLCASPTPTPTPTPTPKQKCKKHKKSATSAKKKKCKKKKHHAVL